MAKRLALAAAIALPVAVVLAFVTRPGPATYHGTHLSPPAPAADFTLASADGPVRVSDFRGRTVALFFGFTSCPDICPATLLRLGTALELLGDDADRVQVVFVSVDPERDSPERADRYARSVDPSFVGLSGAPDDIAAVAADYGIFYEKAEGAEGAEGGHAGHGDGYMVDHTTAITVLNPEGAKELIWSSTVTAEQMAEDLRTLL